MLVSKLILCLFIGTDAEDILMHAFKTFDSDAKGFLNRNRYISCR